MKAVVRVLGLIGVLSATLGAQVPSGMDLESLKQLAAAAQAQQQGATPGAAPATPGGDESLKGGQTGQLSVQDVLDVAAVKESQRLDDEIKAMKAKEKGPRRFAADLFDTRQVNPAVTEGGIADDYVLGTGDQLNLNVFGSATFGLPVQVDGRGEIAIPKVGTVKVAGLTLGKAKQAVQGLVGRMFSRSTVDLQVLKLREVRIFILGEVYKPGGYLVPSLSSLVNVLSLAGGPTAVGSFRDIRVMRGGKLVDRVDLYPLRAEGLGNLNFSLQNGDTIFVPLAGPTVLLEGGFVRVMTQDPDQDLNTELQTKQKLDQAVGDTKANMDAAPAQGGGATAPTLPGVDVSATQGNPSSASTQPGGNPTGGPAELQAALRGRGRGRGTPRQGLHTPGVSNEAERALPVMQFELLPTETALDAVRFAGGLRPSAFPDALSLRRQDREGLTSMQDIPFDQLGQTTLQQGDVLSAFPRRDRVTRMVSVVGWARVPGSFGRPDGLRVGDLLKRDHQVMPDTYLGRGEITRTLPDGTLQYLAFNVAKALEGDPANNLLLADRDRIKLFSIQRMRLPHHVSISGPITLPGTYTFEDGMRAADLIFKGGILDKQANHYYAELARTEDGKVSQIIHLDLAKLVSTAAGSPVNLKDDTLNPPLQDDDQITIYEKPEFRIHRQVRIEGEVARPGTYVIDRDPFTLSDLVARAGGLTPEAMPEAGILLRRLGGDGEDVSQEQTSGALGLPEILDRLNETKMYVQPTLGIPGQLTTPKLFTPPVLHGLDLSKGNRLVVNFQEALKKNPEDDVNLRDGDTIVIPRRTDSVMVLGEAATPFAFYRVTPGMKVKNLLALAGGTTRNADTWNMRLVRADGRIVDHWVKSAKVEPGDALLIPQRIQRDTTWQENLSALTPLALIINAIKR